MRIVIVSMWHNEASLAPFFLGHYAWADRIHLIIGSDTTDNTLAIVKGFPNVEAHDYTFPGGLLNDTLKIEKFNQVLVGLDCDWAIAVDSDELVFTPTHEDPHDYLARVQGNLLQVPMWQVYRHVSEGPLDPLRPALEQRRHGNASRIHHTKPVVVKPEAGVKWTVGHHGYEKSGATRESTSVFWGAHWAYADVDIAIARYLTGRRDRLSEENKRKDYGFHTFDMSEDSIRAECRVHENDPRVF